MSIDTLKMTEAVAAYSTKVLKEVASEYDQTEDFPQEHVQKLIDLGLLELIVSPQEVLKQTYQDFLRMIRLVSQHFPAVGSILLTQATYGIWPLFNFGSEEQKAHYLNQLLKGEIFASFAINEEGAGSELADIETVAIEEPSGWLITGEKAYISNAPVASLFYVVAKTHLLSGDTGYGVFLVDRETPGLIVGPKENKMGIRALPVAGISLGQVRIAKGQLLGAVLQGEKQVESVVNRNRLAISAQGIGIAQGALERGLEYVSYERNFGKRLIDLQATQFRLADVETQILATRAFLLQTLDEALEDTRRVSMVKLTASDLAIKTTETIIDVTGGYGYMRNNDIERFVRDAKITAIYGSTSDTQRKIISGPWRSKM